MSTDLSTGTLSTLEGKDSAVRVKSVAAEASLSKAAERAAGKSSAKQMAKTPSSEQVNAPPQNPEAGASENGRQVQVAFGVIGALPPSLRSRPSLRRSRSSGSSIGTAGEIGNASSTVVRPPPPIVHVDSI